MVKILKNTLKRMILKVTKIIAIFMAVITALCLLVDKVFQVPSEPEQPSTTTTTVSETTIHEHSEQAVAFTFSQVPEFSGQPYVLINNNIPYFKTTEKTTSVFETYSELDNLGRCGVTYANICKELMPTEDRGEIGMVKPSGWTYSGKSNNNKYDFVDGKYIYNRCHLIGFQLAGENANEKNLITGTRYLNIDGMLPFENMVADYVKETKNHVLYRVTPIYKDDELVARGVLMEGYSVEDKGKGIEFCIFAYNVQPGVKINYSTGQNWLENTEASATGYIINTKTKTIHKISCKNVKVNSNFNYVNEDINNLLQQGYKTCKTCNPN